MEFEPSGQTKITEQQTTSTRQLILSPIEWGDGERLIIQCSTPNDMLSVTEEDVRLDYINFQVVGVISKSGEVNVDSFEKSPELIEDINLLLEVNGLTPLTTFPTSSKF